MKQKLFFAIFLFLIFFGTFGVRKSLGAPSTIACCKSGTYIPGIECYDSATDTYSSTVCTISPNNGSCVLNFRREWVCDYSISPTPTNTPTPAPVLKCCNFWSYDPDTKDCVAPPPNNAHKPTNCGKYPCTQKNGDYYCDFSVQVALTSSPFDPCKNLSDSGNDKSLTKCRQCTGIKEDGSFTGKCPDAKGSASCGTWTSLGCIPNDPPNLVGWILGLGSGIAGGIAFLLILFGAGQIVLSGGVPEKIAAGKEIITSAVIGLVFIFVSVLVLQIIGVKILGIPGWS